jgi:hypothetical protein
MSPADLLGVNESTRRMSPLMYRNVRIELAALGADAAAIGAAHRALIKQS